MIKKLFGLIGLVITILLFWYYNNNLPPEKRVMTPESKKQWAEIKKDGKKIIKKLKDEYKKDTVAQEMEEDIKEGYEWSKEKAKKGKEWVKDTYDKYKNE